MKNGPISLLFHCCFIVFLLSPITMVCLVAFTPNGFLSLPTNGFSLRWFVKLGDYPDFFEAFRNSLLIATAASALALVFAAPAAVAIAKYRFFGRDALNAFFMSPLMIPHVVMGIAFLRFLQMLGMSGNIAGLTLGHTIVVFPFAMRMVLAASIGMDKRVDDAAVSLGAPRLVVYRRVILPLIIPGLTSGFALSFIQSFDELTMTVFIASPTTVTLPVRMFNYIQDSIDPLICAVSTLLMLFTTLMMLIIDKTYGLERLFMGENGA